MKRIHLFGWRVFGANWASEDAYRVLELLKEYKIPCRMPSEDMFFVGPFHLPHPERRWQIRVRKRDYRQATALLAREGLINNR